MGYSFRLTARVILYAPSHRQDNTYHGLCYTSRGETAQWVHSVKDRSDDPSHHERTLLPRSYISLPKPQCANVFLLRFQQPNVLIHTAKEITENRPLSNYENTANKTNCSLDTKKDTSILYDQPRWLSG